MAGAPTPSTTRASAAQPSRHPPGLRTLFFTEMWERFSYYGMRALLVLYMVQPTAKGGLGLSDDTATAIYGLYVAAVYLTALPGGWVADRLIGARQAVWWGGLIIAAGHFTLAVPARPTFYLGLLLVALGTGLLKPNVSALVGELYREDERRDAGFTIFYMGINLGAALGPFVCSALGERVNWHYGFAAAGVGMLLGLAQYRLTGARLGEAGTKFQCSPAGRTHDFGKVAAALGGLGLVTALIWSGAVPVNPVWVARGATVLILLIGTLYFAGLILQRSLTALERRRLWALAVLFLAAAFFWAGFEQAGSSFSLFAERWTQREWWGWTIPTGWFQVLSPVFVIALAPVAAAVWTALERQGHVLGAAAKFALGLLFLGAGFLVMALAAHFAASGTKVWPTWLMMTYLLHTLGELCLSPVGLSSVTRLAPQRLVGQMMGLWFLATSFGNLVAGLLAGLVSQSGGNESASRFFIGASLALGAGIVMAGLARPMNRLVDKNQLRRPVRTP